MAHSVLTLSIKKSINASTSTSMATFAFAGLDRNIASIKSKGRLLLCWVDEAEPVTDEAWLTLIPTLREEGSDWNAELWVTWNPKRKNAACEKRYRFANGGAVFAAIARHGNIVKDLH